MTPDWVSKCGKVRLFNADCRDVHKRLGISAADAVICDLPYGITSNAWDEVIPLDELWVQYAGILKPRGVVVLTASQPFASMLVTSNPKWFRHEWVWIKNRGSNFANTVREPFKEHETIQVFSPGKWTYNPQPQERTGGGIDRANYPIAFRSKSSNYRDFKDRPHHDQNANRVPSSWQKFNTEVGLHPNQKPAALMEYLVKTYTNEGETVLDSTMGSGSTGVAAVRLGRSFIGVEIDANYFAIARDRIEAELNSTPLLDAMEETAAQSELFTEGAA